MVILQQLLQYKNVHLLKRYQKDHPHNHLRAEDALQELLKYFWLCERHAKDKHHHPDNQALDFVCGLYPEMLEIDDMWHTFLLFTQEYATFCQHYFHKFLHHVPTIDDTPLSENTETKLSRYLSYVYDHLGEDTLKKWFAQYF